MKLYYYYSNYIEIPITIFNEEKNGNKLFILMLIFFFIFDKWIPDPVIFGGPASQPVNNRQ